MSSSINTFAFVNIRSNKTWIEAVNINLNELLLWDKKSTAQPIQRFKCFLDWKAFNLLAWNDVGTQIMLKNSSRINQLATHTLKRSAVFDGFLFAFSTLNESCYKLIPLSPLNNQCKTFLLITFWVYVSTFIHFKVFEGIINFQHHHVK